MKRTEVDGIIKKIRENQKRLEVCALHDFKPMGERPLGDRFKCKNCQGEVDFHAAHWYKGGLEHAKNENERKNAKL